MSHIIARSLMRSFVRGGGNFNRCVLRPVESELGPRSGVVYWTRMRTACFSAEAAPADKEKKESAIAEENYKKMRN